MATVLEVRDLRTEFRMRSATVGAVDGVSLRVDEGECVGIVGESGCGKSTTGLSIMRLLPTNGHVTAGTISLNGRDLAPLSEKDMRQVRGDEVALIPQDPLTSLNPTMTIGRQIAEGYRLHRDVTKIEARARAAEVLRMVEMPWPEERLDQYPHELSGGLRQRVIIAMALVCEPKLLIADEPTTALDVTIQAQILDLIDDLRRRLRMSVVLITHDMGVIAGRTDRVVVMYAGKVVEEATTETLFSRMRHPYSEALLASVPRLDQSPADRLMSIPGLPPDLSLPISHCRFAARCMYATDVCREEEPPLDADTDTDTDTDVDTDTDTDTAPAEANGERGAGLAHQFACFHPVTHEVTAASVVIREPDRRLDARREQVERAPELLRIEHLVKTFPVRSAGLVRKTTGTVKAVSDVSFTVRKGETFGLVGESGCGKTTIGRLVVALERPDSGSVVFGDRDFQLLHGRELRHRRRDLQMMFQDPYASLNPRMRVGTIIKEPLTVQHEGSAKSREERVRDLLREVGLSPDAAGRYPHEFSGGQRQRIGLARALALEPALVVADEPVSALDVSIQAQILNLMKDLQAKHGLTYITISHDLAVVRYVADTIGVMYLGKLVEFGPAAEVYEHPAHPYTKGLLDAVPVPEVGALEHRAHETAVEGELPSAVDPPSGCRFRTRCPRAQELCRDVEPAYSTFGDGHEAACHFPLETPVSIGAPRASESEGDQVAPDPSASL